MSVPRAKRFNQKQKLAAARLWLQSQNSEKIAKAYRNHFGVDWATVFRELEMLGVQISAVYRETVLKSVAAQAEARKRKKAENWRHWMASSRMKTLLILQATPAAARHMGSPGLNGKSWTTWMICKNSLKLGRLV